MIEVHGLNKLYGDTYAVKDVSFQVAKGEVIGFLGPNGAGKTTTMRIIAGSLGASSGTAKIGGFDVADDPRKAQALLGYSPEVPPLYPSMIVRDFVRFAAEIKGVADPSKAADRALDRVGLKHVGHRIIDNLSKGYRQRVGLAQALVHDPQVLVLDEPTSGLDPAQRVEIRHLIQELAAGDRTVVLSTHVLAEIEAICNRVIVINKGQIVAEDTIANLSQAGVNIRLEVARPTEALLNQLMQVEGVLRVERDGAKWEIHSNQDVREMVAGVCIPYGLIELNGRQRLEDVYLSLTMGKQAKEIAS